MAGLTAAQLREIRDAVCDFFAQECDIQRDTISDSTNIITELQGDSLMLLSLLEMFRKKYGLTVELRALGRRLMKKPANTVGQVIELTSRLVEHGDNILHVEL